MARTTYVYRDGKLIDRRDAPPLVRRFGSAPYVISDCMPALQSMADGRVYDSKSAHVRAAKAAGCEVIGNERQGSPARDYRPDGVGQDIKRAIEELS